MTTPTALPVMPPRTRIPYKDRNWVAAELCARYQAGKSIRELAKDTGYSITRVRNLLDHAGVEYRPRGTPPGARHPRRSA